MNHLLVEDRSMVEGQMTNTLSVACHYDEAAAQAGLSAENPTVSIDMGGGVTRTLTWLGEYDGEKLSDFASLEP